MAKSKSSSRSQAKIQRAPNGKTVVETPLVEEAPLETATDGAPAASYWPIAMVILIVGIALRQIALASFPYHPDEAIHAWFPLDFKNYRFDPIYHGPVMYHLTAATYSIFNGLFGLLRIPISGDNDYTARLAPSLLGIGLLAWMLYGPLRRWIGARGALWSAGLLAISPVIVTYSRRLLHDPLVLLLTLGTILCFQMAREHRAHTRIGRNAWMGTAVLASLFVATKANSFFIIAMLMAFWGATWLQKRFNLSPQILAISRATYWLPITAFVIVSVASVFALRTGDAVQTAASETRFKIICLACTALMWAWLLFSPPANEENEDEKIVDEMDETPREQRRFERRTANWRTSLLSAWAAVIVFAFFYGHGISWWRVPVEMVTNPNQWARTSADSIGNILKTAAGTGPLQSIQGRPHTDWTPLHIDTSLEIIGSPDWDDATMALPRMLEYWGAQQAKPRLPGRHDYYLTLFPLYELPILLAFLPAVVTAARRRSAFTDLLLWWAFTSWVLYAVANEKVPWLLAHMVLPFALLAGWWLGQLRVGNESGRQSTAGRLLWVSAIAGAIFSLRHVSGTNFERAGDHREPLFYAQTTDTFRDTWFDAMATTEGGPTIWLHGERQWPPSWHGRKNGQYVNGSTMSYGAGEPTPQMRFGVEEPTHWGQYSNDAKWQGWQIKSVDHFIWPRPSWPALYPKRFWLWWLTRIAKPPVAPGTDEWQHSILQSPGEFSNSTAVFITPPR